MDSRRDGPERRRARLVALDDVENDDDDGH
jgi:hypothetical protein